MKQNISFSNVKIFIVLDINKLIEDLEISQTKFAKSIGTSTTTVSQMCTGKRPVQKYFEIIIKLKYWRYLGIPKHEIVKELGLNDMVAEPGAGYDPQTPREKYLYQELQEAKTHIKIYQDTIRALQDRKPNK